MKIVNFTPDLGINALDAAALRLVQAASM